MKGLHTDWKQGEKDLSILRQPEHECGQGDPKDTITVSSTIMALARKSIMLNASVSPGPLFRRLVGEKTMPKVHQRVESDVHEMMATRSGIVLDSTASRTGMPMEEAGVHHPTLITGPVSSLSSEASRPEKEVTLQSVLDFSPPPKPVSQERSRILDDIASLINTQCCQEVDEQRSSYSATVSTDSGLSIPFDLRAALRQDSTRIQYQLPSLTASLSPPTSPVRRQLPYTIPLARERESLRSCRVKLPSFKARPLNPKVFTSAGDLGVPRIPKKPLTVPVSPVFSKMRTNSTRSRLTGDGLTRAKSSATMRLKLPATTGIQSTIRFPGHNPIQQPQVDHSMSGAVNGLKIRPFDTKRHITTQLCAISGPPQRQSVSSEPLSGTGSTTNGTNLNVQEKGKHHGAVGQATMLRRPSTRPIPFRFATTELQRRRVAAATFTTVPIASSDALTLEDLV
ncbi:MAG: hypothetical protein J3Q66DRAFT_440666 [Benniella sp.]|nr:MAG: hypothetical protein J3Q66DRAFT_440666 [Benniella sp.]